MPGFTHLQKAQPITLAHHMGAYFEMFKRDQMPSARYLRANELPVRSDPEHLQEPPIRWTVNILQSFSDFDGPTLNSMDGVSDRDYLIELSICHVQRS